MVRIMLSRKMGELRVSQAELARMTGMNPATVNEYYHELVERINLEYLDRICEALHCDICDILELEPNSKTKLVADRSGHPVK